MIKLQLDHTALKYLFEKFGEDFVLEIRNGVLNTAIAKAVKNAVPTNMHQIVRHAVKNEIEEQVGTISYAGYKKYNIELTGPLAQRFKSEVCKVAKDVVEEHMEENKVKAFVVDEVNAARDRFEIAVNNAIAMRFNEALSKHIDEEIKKRLNMITGGVK